VLDIREKNDPKKIGQYEAGNFNHIKVRNNLVFLAGSEFQIISIEQPAKPHLLGSIDIKNQIIDFILKDHYAYVACKDNIIRTLDISRPKNIIETGKVSLPGSVRCICAEGNTILASIEGIGLLRYDFSEPSKLIPMGSFECQSKCPNVVRISQNKMMVLMDGSEEIIDLASGAPWADIRFSETNSVRKDGAFLGNRLFLVDSRFGLFEMDADKNKGKQIGHCDIPGASTNIIIKDNYAYISSSPGALWVVDISTPGFPKIIGHYMQ
jgi:hypothetical protein